MGRRLWGHVSRSRGLGWLILSQGWCLRGHVGWSSWAHGGFLGVGKAKADVLEMRNLTKSPLHQDGRETLSFVNLGQPVRMWSLVSISDWPYGHADVSWGKNLTLYSSIGAWFKIALVALAYKEMGWPRYPIHMPSLACAGVASLRKEISSSGFAPGEFRYPFFQACFAVPLVQSVKQCAQ